MGFSERQPDEADAGRIATLAEIERVIAVGDVVFIRVPVKPFRAVADATGSWTNHVGIVVRADHAGIAVAESTFPFARETPLGRFVRRSEHGRLTVARLRAPLAPPAVACLQRAARRRLGTLYDAGFNLRSRRQFCSRFVREVVAEATTIELGEVETFADLLARRPQAALGFWKAWYFGRIPWRRQTVTPASVLRSAELASLFEGRVIDPRRVRR